MSFVTQNKKNMNYKIDKLNLSIVNNSDKEENKVKSLDHSKIFIKKNKKLPFLQQSKLRKNNNFIKSRSIADLRKDENEIYNNSIEDKTVLAEFIKNYYNKKKQRGYSLIVNPCHNSIFKKIKISKLTENFFK